MILPDLNLGVRASTPGAPVHEAARAWWEALLGNPDRMGLPCVVALGYIRTTTNPRIVSNPLPAATASAPVESWLAQPQV